MPPASSKQRDNFRVPMHSSVHRTATDDEKAILERKFKGQSLSRYTRGAVCQVLQLGASMRTKKNVQETQFFSTEVTPSDSCDILERGLHLITVTELMMLSDETREKLVKWYELGSGEKVAAVYSSGLSAIKEMPMAAE